MLRPLSELDPSRVLSHKYSLISSGAFVVLLVLLHTLTEPLRCNTDLVYNCQSWWPLGIGYFKLPTLARLGAAALIAAVFHLALLRLRAIRFRLSDVIVVSSLLLMATNFLQGGFVGWSNPIACCDDNGEQFYHDAIRISDPLDFLAHYEQLQPGLREHARTHPPGSVLLMFVLDGVLKSPLLIGLAIALLSTVFSSVFLWWILSKVLGQPYDIAGFCVFVFMMVPAVQIYYLASEDAIVSSCIIGSISFFMGRKPVVATIGCAICLFLGSFLTFGFLFVLPVLALYDLIINRALVRSTLAIVGVGSGYYLLYVLTGFNYVNSFVIGSADHLGSYHLLAEPISYFFTRLQDVLEIVMFLGPVLAWLAINTLSKQDRDLREIRVLAVVSLATLAAMFLSGAYGAGETARGCLFIFPFLLLVVSGNFGKRSGEVVARGASARLPYWVFGQSLAMQTFGSYFW
jgi:hypothetical protein